MTYQAGQILQLKSGGTAKVRPNQSDAAPGHIKVMIGRARRQIRIEDIAEERP